MEDKGKYLIDIYYLHFGLLSSMNVTNINKRNDCISYDIHNMSNKKVVKVIRYYETDLIVVDGIECNSLDYAIITIAIALDANIVKPEDVDKYKLNFEKSLEQIEELPFINFLTFLSTFANNIKIVSFCKHFMLNNVYKKSMVIIDLNTNISVTIYDYGFTCSLMDEELILPYDKMIFHMMNYFNIKSLTQIDNVRLN